MENIEVKMSDKQKELIIRNGKALEPMPPQKINIAGNILAPGEWLSVRGANAKTDFVKFSRKSMEIIFTKNEKDFYADVVSGTLNLNDDLNKFRINDTNDLRSTADLAKFLKMNRMFFADTDKCAKIITELKSLKAKIQTEIEQQQNDRGNSKSLVNVNVTSNVPLNFKLKMPVFVGFGDKTFNVEICLETSERTVGVWLESAELNEIIISERDAIINSEIAKFRKAGVPVIEY